MKESHKLLAKRLKALGLESNRLLDAIEGRLREAGPFQKYISHNEDAIQDYCRKYEDARTAILNECKEIDFITFRFKSLPEIDPKNYNRTGSLLKDLWQHLSSYGGASVTLRPFREKLRLISETCSSILFVMENPSLLRDESR